MQTVIIVVHLIIVLALIAVVLLQRSEGGLGLGGGGSGGVSGFMTGRGQANALTRATAVLAGLFFLTSMVLAIISHRGSAPRSIFEGTSSRPAAGSPAPAESAPAGQPGGAQGNFLDQLRQLQDAPGTAPSAPPQVPQSR